MKKMLVMLMLIVAPYTAQAASYDELCSGVLLQLNKYGIDVEKVLVVNIAAGKVLGIETINKINPELHEILAISTIVVAALVKESGRKIDHVVLGPLTFNVEGDVRTYRFTSSMQEIWVLVGKYYGEGAPPDKELQKIWHPVEEED